MLLYLLGNIPVVSYSILFSGYHILLISTHSINDRILKSINARFISTMELILVSAPYINDHKLLKY